MKKTQIALLIGLAFGATAASAQQATASGSLELGVLATDKSNSEGGKMREYRDLEDGLILNGDYGVFNKSYYFNIQGDNVGRDDQFLGARGGMYDTFKYSLYNDKILHNLTGHDNLFDCIRPGVGNRISLKCRYAGNHQGQRQQQFLSHVSRPFIIFISHFSGPQTSVVTIPVVFHVRLNPFFRSRFRTGSRV